MSLPEKAAVLLWAAVIFSTVTTFEFPAAYLGKDYNLLVDFYHATFETGRFPMPVYDYLCNDCGKEFEKVLSLNEHDHDHMTCPHCGSENVEQEAKAFFAVTSRKS